MNPLAPPLPLAPPPRGLSAEQAAEKLQSMSQEMRYLRDVWS